MSTTRTRWPSSAAAAAAGDALVAVPLEHPQRGAAHDHSALVLAGHGSDSEGDVWELPAGERPHHERRQLLDADARSLAEGLTAAVGQIKLGKLRAIAIYGNSRAPVLPEVPTMSEAGVKGYEFSTWYGLVVPAGTPTPGMPSATPAGRGRCGRRRWRGRSSARSAAS